MTNATPGAACDGVATVVEIERTFDRLWPIMRSLSGQGVRTTLDVLGEIASPMDRIEVPSGSHVFDWVVPSEWQFNEAYIIDPNGLRILDASENTLHLVNYSVPFRGRMTLDELQPHLFSIPERPAAVPYVTSYYTPRWGFCLSQEMRDSLPSGEYEVVVDCMHKDGGLTLGEVVLPGKETAEVLFSTYVCHPSLAHNELSGPLVAAYLCRALAALPDRRLTYRFLFSVETIGAISYLACRGDHLRSHLAAGYVVTCVGTEAPYTYKRSRRGDSLADRAALQVLRHRAPGYHEVIGFDPADASDERQYCSPGFDLPVGSLMRMRYNTYPEYHTSDDNKSFVSFDAMRETIGTYLDVCHALEANVRYENTIKFCEPQLGPRGLYGSLGGVYGPDRLQSALLWLLNLADGTRDLLAIAERSGLEVGLLAEAARLGAGGGVLARVG